MQCVLLNVSKNLLDSSKRFFVSFSVKFKTTLNDDVARRFIFRFSSSADLSILLERVFGVT